MTSDAVEVGDTVCMAKLCYYEGTGAGTEETVDVTLPKWSHFKVAEVHDGGDVTIETEDHIPVRVPRDSLR